MKPKRKHYGHGTKRYDKQELARLIDRVSKEDKKEIAPIKRWRLWWRMVEGNY